MSRTYYGKNGTHLDANISAGNFLDQLTFGLFDTIGCYPKNDEECKIVARILKNYIHLNQFWSPSWKNLYGVSKDDNDSLMWMVQAVNFFENAEEIIDEEDMSFYVITLCGSTRFKDYWEYVSRELSLQGFIILSTGGLFGHQDNDSRISEEKEMLDLMHKYRIDMASEIFVLDIDGYIGESTQSEINYAVSKNKVVRYFSESEFKDISLGDEDAIIERLGVDSLPNSDHEIDENEDFFSRIEFIQQYITFNKRKTKKYNARLSKEGEEVVVKRDERKKEVVDCADIAFWIECHFCGECMELNEATEHIKKHIEENDEWKES